MKFTSEDLMKAMGLQVGDRVKVMFNGHIFIITNTFKLESTEDKQIKYDIHWLVDKNIQILPRPKRVGNLKCREIDNCMKCPLQWLCFRRIHEKEEMETSLYEMLESLVVTDQEIYDLLKARLDKEVLE